MSSIKSTCLKSHRIAVGLLAGGLAMASLSAQARIARIEVERSDRSADGSYQVAAGRALQGTILGGYRYAGTRPDDPNDIVPHEHRRELRALRVFGAWTNLTDLKAGNTLDTLIAENGRAWVKHYLQDVGSTFGMCNDVYEWDLSWEYFYEAGPTRRPYRINPRTSGPCA